MSFRFPNLIAGLGLMCIALLGCKPELQPIRFDEDQCSSCKMTISDKRFGAELVTKKGKVYKYDAMECTLRELASAGLTDYALIATVHFDDPGSLKEARESWYLVAEARPSPMGGNLSAYSSREKAETLAAEMGGRVYNFEQILELYSQN